MPELATIFGPDGFEVCYVSLLDIIAKDGSVTGVPTVASDEPTVVQVSGVVLNASPAVVNGVPHEANQLLSVTVTSLTAAVDAFRLTMVVTTPKRKRTYGLVINKREAGAVSTLTAGVIGTVAPAPAGWETGLEVVSEAVEANAAAIVDLSPATTIAAWVAAAQAGYPVRLAPGEYIITEPIVLTGEMGLTLQGSGCNATGDNTTQYWGSKPHTRLIADSGCDAIFKCTACRNMQWSDMTLERPNAGSLVERRHNGASNNNPGEWSFDRVAFMSTNGSVTDLVGLYDPEGYDEDDDDAPRGNGGEVTRISSCHFGYLDAGWRIRNTQTVGGVIHSCHVLWNNTVIDSDGGGQLSIRDTAIYGTPVVIRAYSTTSNKATFVLSNVHVDSSQDMRDDGFTLFEGDGDNHMNLILSGVNVSNRNAAEPLLRKLIVPNLYNYVNGIPWADLGATDQRLVGVMAQNYELK